MTIKGTSVICGYLSENFGFQELLAFHKIRPDILNLDMYSAAMRSWKKVCNFQLPFTEKRKSEAH
jgi:hypothetical protein